MNENVQIPSFPKVSLVVRNGAGDVIIENSPCKPHELSAVLAIFQPDWMLVLTAVE